MRGPIISKLLIILAAYCSPGGHSVLAFEAGWAKVEITPSFPAPLAGFGERFGKPFESISDPLYVRAIVIDNGTEKIALASADLVAIHREFREAIVKKLAAKQLKYSALTLMATHTHSSIGGYWENTVAEKTSMGKFDEKIFEFLTTRVTDAIVQAEAAKAPARIGGSTTKLTGFNRNRRDQARPVDSELTVIRIDDLRGHPQAAIVNFAAHATMLGAKNLAISPDYPGAVSAALEKKLAVALFAVGASGDLRPLSPPGKDRYEKARLFGRSLAEKATEIFAPLRTSETLQLKSHAEEINLPRATLYGALGFASVVFDPIFRRYVPATTLLQAIRLNDIVITAWPTEPVATIGLDFKKIARERFGIQQPIVASLANDYIGYMPTESDFTSWGYETSASFFGPKLAEKLTASMSELLQRVR